MSSMFGIMSTIMPVFFVIVFVIVIGMFVSTAIRSGSEYASNKAKPIETVPATIVGKRTHNWHRSQNSASHTSYYITFELENGERIEMPASGRNYGLHAEGDVGMLKHQGTHIISFEREII